MNGDGNQSHDDDVAGPPIAELQDLEQETSADFVLRVRRKIHRRTATSQLASFSWNMPRLLLTEIAGLFQHLFSVIGGGKDSRPAKEKR